MVNVLTPFLVAILMVCPAFIDLPDWFYYFSYDLVVLALCVYAWYWIPFKKELFIKNCAAGLVFLSLSVLIFNLLYAGTGDDYPVSSIAISIAVSAYLVYRSNKKYLQLDPPVMRGGRIYYIYKVNPRSNLEVFLLILFKFSSVKFAYNGDVYKFSRSSGKFEKVKYEGHKLDSLVEYGFIPKPSHIEYLENKVGQDWSIAKSCFTTYLKLEFGRWR